MLNSLGIVEESLGNFDAALETLEEAMRFARSFGNRQIHMALTDARRAERAAFAQYRRASRQGRLSQTRSARKAWDKVRAEVGLVARRVEREAKRAAAVTLPAPDDLAAMQRRLAPHDVLVYYALTVEEGVALVVGAQVSRKVALASSKEIRAAVDALLDGEQVVDAAKVPALQKLLVEPLELGRDVKRILVSPMGRLGYVPFALLFPEREVAYVPSGTTYGLLLADEVERGDKILALGDPDYEADVDEDALRSRAGGVTRLARLPATRREVEAIADVRFLGKRATETGLQEAVSAEKRWRAVHFACHGLVDPERPMLSALALTADKKNDGFLTALEIFRMNIPADLVVLSACETGKGRIYRTEGIVGLTRAFMYAGAPRVICSLWKVDDKATQALMVKFYELWNPKKGKGLGAAAALRQAQGFVRGQPKWKHPYYWAAWVLWGLPE